MVVTNPMKQAIEVPRLHRQGGAQCPWTMERRVPEHKFKVGQSVSFTSGPFGRGGTSGIYKITQLLPPEDDDYQYRIKSDREPHERVVKESQLDRLA